MKRGGMVDILMGEVEHETNPINNADMSRRKDVVKPEQMVDMLWFEPATTETVAVGLLRARRRHEGGRAAEGARHPDARGRGALGRVVEWFAITSNTAAGRPSKGTRCASSKGSGARTPT